MKNIITISIVVAGMIALSGCAPKKSCNSATKKNVVKPVAKKVAPVKVVPAIKAKSDCVVQEAPRELEPEVLEAPSVDSKSSSVR